ncbi:MAG: 1-acyl-sn-glycerol-3-phosphate acyltransferase [Deltaproteobacteria bacterium]|nr:1-acyl-sn-glycerol-3-phosphate acyltransferase [Deltaproteobacteria bacterium]
MKVKDKERILVEVVQRTLDHWTSDPATTEEALFGTIYQERQRIEKERNRKKARKEGSFYNDIYHEALQASPGRQRELLKKIIQFFSNEVVGHFDPRVYALATRIIPPALNLLLNTVSPLRLLETLQGSNSLMDQLAIEGETDAIKKVAKLGTTILVPTHSSNLDSILVGFTLFRLGLPPYTYGAGLNLFSNKLMGFFMHNLGAYTVDRRKRAPVYKDVLKTYAGCSMELDYHNLFFPGGTRSRSGKVETHLKMGLLGMGLDAYVHNLRAKKAKPDIFVIPCTINYQLVLEAETLIGDHLKEIGKSRYIIEDDEFSKPKRIFEFIKQLFSLHSKIHMIISKPLDLFGNEVDADGLSRDHRGRPVDRKRYVQDSGGQPTFNNQRDKEYTRELGRAISAAYHRDTVIKSTNLVSRAVFDLLLENNPNIDLYRLLRTGGSEESFALPDAYRRVDQCLAIVRKLEQQGRLKLDQTLKDKDTVAVVSEALAHLGSYHHRPALKRRGDRLFHIDRTLLLYYQNRFEGFDAPELERRT